MDDNEDAFDLKPAPGDNIILEARVPDELLMHFRGVLNLIEVIANLRLSEDIHRAVVVVIAESSFTDDRCTLSQMFLGSCNHCLFIWNLLSGQINCHFFVWAKHAHGLVTKIIPGVQPCLHLRRNDAKAGLVLVQPEHLATLHATPKVGFCDGHDYAFPSRRALRTSINAKPRMF